MQQFLAKSKWTPHSIISHHFSLNYPKLAQTLAEMVVSSSLFQAFRWWNVVQKQRAGENKGREREMNAWNKLRMFPLAY